MRAIVNIIAGLILASFSVLSFFLVAETVTRLRDRYTINDKVSQIEYDWSSRLEGYAIEKKPGVSRILVLGDSIAYGQGVKKNETFSKKLEEMLNSGDRGQRFEVINTGFCGSNTIQELGILLNKGPDPLNRQELANEGFQGLSYKPDIVLLQYTVQNDAEVYDPMRPELFVPHRWHNDGARRYNHGNYALPLPENIDRWLTLHSRFYLFFLNKYHGFLTKFGLRDEVKRVRAMYNPESKGWQATSAAISQIAHIARTYNMPAVMVLWATNDGMEFKDIYTFVGKTGRDAGFHTLDLSKDIKWPEENFSVSMTDGHPNAKAHKIAAESIYNFLEKKGLLSK